MARLWVPFYRKALPVFNAPAINNALEAANSGMLFNVYGAGVPNRGSIRATEVTQLQAPVAIVNGIGGYPNLRSFGSQGLVDPNAKRKA